MVLGPDYLLWLPSVLTSRFPSAFCNCHPQGHELPCQSCVRSRSAVVRGRSDAPGKSTESTRSLAPSAQRLPQSCLSCSCQLTTRRNAISLIYRSSAAALHTQPRHTAPAHWHTTLPGTLAHRHAPRHTSTQAAVVSFPSHSHHIPITSLPRMPVPE